MASGPHVAPECTAHATSLLGCLHTGNLPKLHISISLKQRFVRYTATRTPIVRNRFGNKIWHSNCIRMQHPLVCQLAMKFDLSAMRSRWVPYAELQPCTTAFVDARTPGSDRKENFTIIGPGVAENPDQHVHISIPHGFNIGGARQPPGCVNSQHSHETAEVFIVHSGQWRFMSGEHGEDGEVHLGPGDVISLPTHLFRGFENIGTETGFMFAVLGGDDPGRVTWAPYVFEQAALHGLVLLENGSLLDTTQSAVPAGAKLMPVTAAADIALLQRLKSADLENCVVRAGAAPTANSWHEQPLIGAANAALNVAAGPLDWPHGFVLRRIDCQAGASSQSSARVEAEVILMHQGELLMEWADNSLRLGPGDTLTVPKGLVHRFTNPGVANAVAFVVRGGDYPDLCRAKTLA